ncbi:MAG: TIGR02757 family protein [Saprospiraceae bacterium]|nr:TIGR02757 family protein [Saprospiraceae bacterium]
MKIKQLLDDAVLRFNKPSFIADDPIGIPHRFTGLQDREIMGFWTAVLAWGQRVTIIRSAEKLIDWMDGTPHAFITGHSEPERARFERFVHRTFQGTDALYFLDFFQRYYAEHASLEEAFARHLATGDLTTERALIGFHRDFFDHPWAPRRTRKHIATPEGGSTCKRINMFLRWMVRRDEAGVDFGIWRRIQPSQLLMPLDVHVDRVARRLGLLTRRQTDWGAVLELTDKLRVLAPDDPVRYDFALFGLGVLDKLDLALSPYPDLRRSEP